MNANDLPGLRDHIRMRRTALAGFMERGAALALDGDVLLVIPRNDIYVRYLADNCRTLAELASELYGRPIRAEIAGASEQPEVTPEPELREPGDEPPPGQEAVRQHDRAESDAHDHGTARDSDDSGSGAQPKQKPRGASARDKSKAGNAGAQTGTSPRREPRRADPVEIGRAVALLCEPGAVHELRAPNTAKATASGYFDDRDKLIKDAASIQAPGVYLTLNATRRDHLARANNRIEYYAKHTTTDADIASRRWFPIDLDALRPSGISSTDAEHEAALERAQQIRGFLTERGWPMPISADSGNGGHLVYQIAETNDTETTALLKRVLEALDSLFSDDTVTVDRTTYNAARIWKIYGTIAAKGDNMPDRPHRMARILESPEMLAIVTREQLEELAKLAPKPEQSRATANKKGGTSSPFNLDDFIARHSIAVKRTDAYQGGRRIILEACVFDSSHTGTSAAIIESANGSLGYSCLHNGCVDRHWADVRELFEPGYRERHALVTTSSGAVLAASTPDGTVFKQALTAPDFLAQTDTADGALVAGGLLARSGITLLASPRGLGKSLLALKLAIELANGGEFCGERLPASKVLLCAYENSPALLRERIKRLGGAESENLRILTRSKAPKLAADDWRAFPVEDYDFIIIDSLSPALEGGIDEREGGQNSDALAALLDIVQRGPGALLIANTDKAAKSIRGSGILSDRADLIFEVRDATDFKPRPKDEVWWDGLVENQGEAAWAGRAKRRRGKTTFRLALIPSKTRIGPELEPRVLELALPADGPWTVNDVSVDVARAHERSRTEAVEQRQAREDAAVAALKAALPLPKAEAETLLTHNKLSRKAARQIIEARAGADWILAGAGTKADPYILRAIDGENADNANPNGERRFEHPILAAPAAEGRQESMFKNDSATDTLAVRNSRRDHAYISPSASVSERICPGCSYRAYDPERVFCPACGRAISDTGNENLQDFEDLEEE